MLFTGMSPRDVNYVWWCLCIQYNKSPAQVLVRWSLQRGYVRTGVSHSRIPESLLFSFAPLPKSSNPERVASNADVYNFEIASEDVQLLDALDRGKEGAITWNPIDVD